jgi:hypothetical protein
VIKLLMGECISHELPHYHEPRKRDLLVRVPELAILNLIYEDLKPRTQGEGLDTDTMLQFLDLYV